MWRRTNKKKGKRPFFQTNGPRAAGNFIKESGRTKSQSNGRSFLSIHCSKTKDPAKRGPIMPIRYPSDVKKRQPCDYSAKPSTTRDGQKRG